MSDCDSYMLDGRIDFYACLVYPQGLRIYLVLDKPSDFIDVISLSCISKYF